MISTTIYAQIYSFEDSSVPSNFNVNIGSISISGQKYKLGKQSLQDTSVPVLQKTWNMTALPYHT